MEILIFLSGGMFLGWSLGANNAADVFGSAVGSKMVRFRTAAIIASVCVVLGAFISGSGAAKTLGELGSVNEFGGAFIVTLSAAVTTYLMTKMTLPVSVSQAIVGAIIGWNFFSGSLTDYSSLAKILVTWFISPVLSGLIAMVLFKIVKYIIANARLHLIRQDLYTRFGLIIAGALGSYSLGANNVANVVGVFVPVYPFKPLDLGLFGITSSEQLFLLGGIAIAVGILTYSRKVMTTVGEGVMKMNPESALVVVLSTSIVMFLFASEQLEALLLHYNLPTIPLVPVSSTQTVIGAILGIGILKGGKGINYVLLGKIAMGWIATPLLSLVFAFISLFIIQNVFSQRVYRPEPCVIGAEVEERLAAAGVDRRLIGVLAGRRFGSAVELQARIRESGIPATKEQIHTIASYAKVLDITVRLDRIGREISEGWFTPGQLDALRRLEGTSYTHLWQLQDALEGISREWCLTPESVRNKKYNKEVRVKISYLARKFYAGRPAR